MATAGAAPSRLGLVPRTVLTSSVGVAAAFALASAARAALGLGPLYPLKASAAFAVIMAVAVRGLAAHHAFDRLGPANRVTMLRAWLVALVAGLIGEPTRASAALAAGLTALAATVLDAVDGRAARRSGMASRFGARFDMEVDAVLVLVLSLLVYQFEKAGVWVLASGLLRYGFVAAGWGLPWMRRALPPSRRRQTVCVIQMAGLMLALAPFVPQPVSRWAAGLSLTILAWSFWVDARWLWIARGGYHQG